jgi:hypothetical protein
MFILTTDQELCARELIYCIMGYDHSLGLKEFLYQLNLFYIFEYIYIYNRSRVIDMRANGRYYGLQPLSRPEEYT